MPFVVPNPIKTVAGISEDKGLLGRWLDDTGPRWYLVVSMDCLMDRLAKCLKCDTLPKPLTADVLREELDEDNLSAAVLYHLSKYAPLAMVVHSASGGMQGWFHFLRQEEAEALKFFKHAVSLGADWRMWLPTRLARVPDGPAANGQSNRVFYFDPRIIHDFFTSHRTRPGQELLNLVKECSDIQE
jgi:hypothetical protein